MNMANTYKWIFFSLFFLFLYRPIIALESDRNHLRFVMIGLSHGHSHWIFQNQFQGDFELVGVYEPDNNLVEQFRERYNLDEDLFFPGIEIMLDQLRPDGALAFGPISEHLDVVRSCAPKGIHVMVEKPLAFSLSHAREMEKLANSNGIHLLTNYETSWYPTTDAAINQVWNDKGELGQIRKAVFHHGHRGPKEIGVGPEF